MRLVWAERAAQDLETIESYIAHDNPTAAITMIDKLIAQAETLLEHPRKGCVVPEVANPDIRELIVSNYRLVYRIHAKTLEVLQIFEGHRQLRDL